MRRESEQFINEHVTLNTPPIHLDQWHEKQNRRVLRGAIAPSPSYVDFTFQCLSYRISLNGSTNG